jgi:hypothetical protein
MTAARAAALAVFAMRANLRSPMAVGGALAFAAIAALGPLASVSNGHGWVLDPDLLFYGYLTGSLFALRSGLEQQRDAGLQTYLRHNFATPVEHALGAVLSLVGTWLVLTGLLFLLAALYSGGDLGSAAWLAWSHGLGIAVLLPFVVMVESVSASRIPLLLPVLAYLALAMLLAAVIGAERMVAILGTGGSPSDPRSWLHLAARAAVVVLPGMALFLAGTWLLARGPQSQPRARWMTGMAFSLNRRRRSARTRTRPPPPGRSTP